MNKYTNFILVCSISACSLLASSQAFAVGGGLEFNVENSEKADSLDFTYHACTDGPVNQKIKELGYFWISSYQDSDSVVDSHINFIGANGYHIYGRYEYKAIQVGAAQPSVSGTRLNYQVSTQDAGISLYIDPNKDTELAIQNCQFVITGNTDDIFLGNSNTVVQGEKSETNGLANGDFKVVFNNWVWDLNWQQEINDNQQLNLEDFNFLVFNGNITNLGGPLGDNHNPEGSGNLFWLETFVPVNDGDNFGN